MEIKNLKINYLKLKILGMGALGICFLMPNGKVLKLFFNANRLWNLKRKFPDLIEHFAEINSIGNETYMVPETLLTKNDNVIGYIANYGRGHQIAHMSKSVPLNQIILAYKPLIKATKIISEQKFQLKDIHNGNILYDEVNNRFSCIDLDHGSKINLDSDAVLRLNMRAINDCIICSLFGIDSRKKDIEFWDYNLQKRYLNATRREYAAISDFFAYIQDLMDDPDVTHGTLCREKKKILRAQTSVDYYNQWF